MITNNKFTVAVFDFDGTLIKKNSLIDFFYYTFSFKKFVFCLFYISPSILKYLAKIISNSDLKEKMLAFYLKKMSKDKFNQLCFAYKDRLAKLEKTEAIEKLLWHKNQGDKIIIISASPENWILPWARQYEAEVMATRLEEKNDFLTGKLSGQNCYGPEKVRRLLEKYPNRSDYNLYVYGDGASDTEILELADYPFHQRFEAGKTDR